MIFYPEEVCGRVLFELSPKAESVKASRELFESCDELKDALASPAVEIKEKEKVIDKLFPVDMRNFLKVMCQWGHMDNIMAEAAQDPAVVAAKAELDAVEGGSHLYGEKKAAYEAAFNTAFLNVRNKYVQEFQKTYNTASKKEGRYYILNETPEQANERYLKEHGISKEAAAAQSKEEAAKAEAAAKAAEAGKAGKAGSKQADKALPKTSAVK